MRRLSTIDAPRLTGCSSAPRLLLVTAGERQEHVVQARFVHGEGRRQEARSVSCAGRRSGCAGPSLEVSLTVASSRSTAGWRPVRRGAPDPRSARPRTRAPRRCCPAAPSGRRSVVRDDLTVVDHRDRARRAVGLLEVLRRQRHVVPSLTSSFDRLQSPLRLGRSSPVVGSSRNRTGGLVTRAAAMSNRRASRRSRCGRPVGRVAEVELIEQLAARGMMEVSIWVSSPIRRRFSAPGQVGVDRRELARETDPAADRVRVGRRRRARGPSPDRRRGWRTVARIRTAVVFPAPFGPRRPKIDRGGTEKSMPSRATTSPNRFLSPSTSIRSIGHASTLAQIVES